MKIMNSFRIFWKQRWVLKLIMVLCFILTGARQVYAEESSEVFELQTPHAIVMEVSTGTILHEKDADAKVHPASVTKIMTVLLTFEAIEQGKLSLEQEVTTSAYAKSMGGSQVFLETGERQTVDTLLKCILVASGNDAAVTMAEQIAGSEDVFVDRMNEKAKQLHMNNTHFVDCCGLTDSDQHYTTARDVALMSAELLRRFPQVVEYTSIWMEDITHVTARGSSVFTLANTNKLLRSFDGCDGLKTGSTSKAKYCLSATAKKDDIRLIAVVLTAPDSKIRFDEAGKLLGYGFSKCSLYKDEDMPKLEPILVPGSLGEPVRVEYKEPFSYLSTSEEDFSEIHKEIVWQEDLKAPCEKGQIAGKCIYTINDKNIGEAYIVFSDNVKKANFYDYVKKVLAYWTI